MTNGTGRQALHQHQLLQEIYVLLDDGDRRVLEEVQLTTMEFALLNRLHRNHGRRLTDIGAELLCVKSTITRLVDRLEQAGYVQRTPDLEDRRAQRLLLTESGEVVRAKAQTLHSDAVARRLSALSPDEQSQLTELLSKLRSGIQKVMEN